MKTFGLNLCNVKTEHGCLNYHIGNCAGNCRPDFDLQNYLFRIQLAQDALKNNQQEFIHKVTEQMRLYSMHFEFEKAHRLHSYLQDVHLIFSTINMHFNEQKFATDIFIASAVTPYHKNETTIHTDLQKFINAPTPIRTIDCFDISHFQSADLVGSCVRFTDGKPDKPMFRRFKIKTLTIQNDYAALQEIVQRRYKTKSDYPDLIVIDGGKGQLNAVQQVLPDVRIVSLAKREEMLYGTHISDGIRLDIHTTVGRLLIALRDYAHHFAVSYHRLRRKTLLHETKKNKA
jgi:excinuclease ABC subunit C